MIDIMIHICGWTGTVLIVGAYYLVSTEKIRSSDALYQWLNLIGSLILGINVFYKKAWPAVALEAVWSAIAIFALIKLSQRKTS